MTDNTTLGVNCGCMTLMALLYIPLVMWTHSLLNFWVSHVAGKEVDIHWFWSALISLFEPIVLLNIIAEIARQTM